MHKSPPYTDEPSSDHASNIMVVSDLHIGAAKSMFAEHDDHGKQHTRRAAKIRRTFDNAIKRAGHIVLNGDTFDFADVIGKKKQLPAATDAAIAQLEAWMDTAPNSHFHLVLGNKDNCGQFREKLDQLASKHPDHFEWHPEAIMLGSMLCTHGDLQLRNQTDATRDLMENQTSPPKQKKRPLEKNAVTIYEHLTKCAKHGSRSQDADATKPAKDQHIFHVSVDGHNRLLTKPLLAQVKHIAYGHTHEKFYALTLDDIQFHNSGGVRKDYDNKAGKLGFLGATLMPNGNIHNVVSYKDSGKEDFLPPTPHLSTGWVDFHHSRLTAFRRDR